MSDHLQGGATRNLLNAPDLRKLTAMKVMTQPVIKQSRQHEEARTAKEWLDYLVSGACNLPAFLSGAGDLLRKAPDDGWDLLSLVDQYYRRGKISAELFGAV